MKLPDWTRDQAWQFIGMVISTILAIVSLFIALPENIRNNTLYVLFIVLVPLFLFISLLQKTITFRILYFAYASIFYTYFTIKPILDIRTAIAIPFLEITLHIFCGIASLIHWIFLIALIGEWQQKTR